MNRLTTFGLALPALLVSSVALAGEPPFPAPRTVPVDRIDEDALRDDLREDLRQEVRDQMRDERDALQAERDRLERERELMERDRQLELERIERERQLDMEPEDDRDVIIIDRGVEVPAVEPEFRQHSLAVGAGALGFVDTGLSPTGSAAPTWNLRYGFTPIEPLTWEVSYVGAVRVEDQDTNLTATLFETGLKVNTIPDSVIYPIVMAGIGYGAWTNPDDDDQDLSTLTVPLGVGVEIAAGNFLISGRGTYRPVFFDDDVGFTGAGADNWTLTADIGARF